MAAGDQGRDLPLRLVPRLTLLLLSAPVLGGLAGTVLPAFAGDLAAIIALLGWTGLPAAVWLSVKTGVVSTIGALGLCLVIVAGLGNTRAFGAIQHLLAPLLSVPHAAAALGLAFLIAPSGWIARAISPWLTGWDQPPDLLILNDPGGWTLTLGLMTKELPFLLLMALAALPQTDAPRRMLQAQTLGAGRIAAFVVGVLPSLYAQMRLPVYAVLAYSMTAVDMALILGPTRPPTLSAQIVIWMNDPALTDRATAAAGATLQFGLVLMVLAGWRTCEFLARRALMRAACAGLRAPALDAPARMAGLFLGFGSALVLLVGLAGLGLWSVAGLWTFPQALPETISASTWMRAGADLMETTAETLLVAVSATFVALILVLACLEAERRFGYAPDARVLSILYLPLIIPQIAFLPGLQGLALRIGVEGTWPAVAGAHLVFVLPYVFLSLSAPYRAMDPRYSLVAQSLGATPGRIFRRIILPVLLRPVLTAAAVGLAVSIGQYLPTLLIGGGRVETLTTEAVALSSGGNRRLIGAYGLLQTLLPAIGFGLALALPSLLFRNRRGMGVQL